jgi:hypothetical protein
MVNKMNKITICAILLSVALLISCSQQSPQVVKQVVNSNITVSSANTIIDNNTEVIVLHKVTYQQIVEFLDRDDTDKIKYSDDFNCDDFTILLRDNAIKDGIKCGWVDLVLADKGKLTSYGHALNVFDTLDKGLVYVDAQVDGIFDSIPYINQSMTELYSHMHQTKWKIDPKDLDYGTQYIYRIKYIW